MDPSIFWYTEPLSRGEFRALFRGLKRSGLSLTHPLSGDASRLDELGERQRLPSEELLSEIELAMVPGNRPREIAFQLWLSADSDVYCDFAAPDGALVCQRYGLDGLSRERGLVVRALWQEVLALAHKTAAFGVDTEGDALELDLEAAARDGEFARVYDWDFSFARSSDATVSIDAERPVRLVFEAGAAESRSPASASHVDDDAPGPLI